MGLRRCSGTGFNHEPTARLLKDRVMNISAQACLWTNLEKAWGPKILPIL